MVGTATRATVVHKDFEQFYGHHVDEVYRYLRVRSSAELAEELTAEVFVSAFKTWSVDEHLQTGWLITVARRRLIDEWRRQARSRDRQQHLAIVTPTESAASDSETETRMLVMEVLDSLPPLQRQALLLCYLDDLSVAAVAVILNRSYRAVESLLARARRNFARLYAATSDDEEVELHLVPQLLCDQSR